MTELTRARKEVRQLALGLIIFQILLFVVVFVLVYPLYKDYVESMEATKVIPLSGQENITLYTLDGGTLSFNRIVKIEVSQRGEQK